MKFATISKSLVMGLALATGLQRVRSHQGASDIKQPDNHQRHPAEGWRLQVGVGRQRSNVEVSIIQGKTVLAKVPAKVVDLSTPAQNSAAVVQRHDDGTSTLAGVRFEGKKFALEIGDSSDGMQPGSSK